MGPTAGGPPEVAIPFDNGGRAGIVDSPEAMTELVNSRDGAGLEELPSPVAGEAAPVRAIGRRGYLVRRMLLAADVVGLFVALAATAILNHGGIAALKTAEFGIRAVAMAGLIPLFVVTAKIYGLYDRDDEHANHSTIDEIVGLFHLLTVAVWSVVALGVVTGMLRFDKTWVTLWLTMILAVAATRAVARVISSRLPGYRQNTIVIGTGPVARLVATKIARHAQLRMNLVGLLDPEHEAIDLADIVASRDVDRIVIAVEGGSQDDLEELLRQARDLGVHVDVAPRLGDVIGPYVRLHAIEGLPLVSLPQPHLARSSLFLKRLVDVVVALGLLTLLSPLLVVCMLAIKLTSPGPVFFRQLRIGTNRVPFSIYKFRTMVADAEDRKSGVAHLNKHLGAGGDPRMFKIAGDPRVTRVGALLRRYSIDELPQLLNVLRGEMSMVGPRPLIPDEDQFVSGTWALRRVELKPGLTGLWQVLGRSAIPFEEMVKLDYLYVTGWSLTTDLRLMAQTIPAIFRPRDAY
jgi:exopolysaccharide biosynthesis polyprenyl glycosylphosphotransferase